MPNTPIFTISTCMHATPSSYWATSILSWKAPKIWFHLCCAFYYVPSPLLCSSISLRICWPVQQKSTAIVYRCQHNGSETVSLRAYRQHKQYCAEGLSSEFQQFIASKTIVPPTSMASSLPHASTLSEGESFPDPPGKNGILMDLDINRLDIVGTSSLPTCIWADPVPGSGCWCK